ncbi:putative short-chain dehydrogenase [Lophiotrema nucula]|uniref:Putative short-chain dehydrogenase n=1 Tax=Lophiotrema nucula TaxID=690887 RepID=A0A6A5YM59_9PLEO|nr:putative short-chain dehydrogenase [Lophiotrema nucula]
MPSYVIIGASRGLGYQYLKTLSQDPSNVVIGTARSVGPTAAKVAEDKLPNVHIIAADLTSAESLKTSAEEVSKITGGSVDHLIVNGAYLSPQSQFLAASEWAGKEDFFLEELNASMLANVAGVLFTINAYLPLIRKSTVKKVIVITSGVADFDAMAKTGISGGIPYSLSKAAVNGVVSKFAVESRNKGEGITYIALSPGFVATSAFEGPITPEIQTAVEGWMTGFKKLEPNFSGPIQTDESVEKQLEVIHSVTEKDSGAFISHHGNKKWL